jgi:hypothetical protein
MGVGITWTSRSSPCTTEAHAGLSDPASAREGRPERVRGSLTPRLLHHYKSPRTSNDLEPFVRTIRETLAEVSNLCPETKCRQPTS